MGVAIDIEMVCHTKEPQRHIQKKTVLWWALMACRGAVICLRYPSA